MQYLRASGLFLPKRFVKLPQYKFYETETKAALIFAWYQYAISESVRPKNLEVYLTTSENTKL